MRLGGALIALMVIQFPFVPAVTADDAGEVWRDDFVNGLGGWTATDGVGAVCDARFGDGSNDPCGVVFDLGVADRPSLSRTLCMPLAGDFSVGFLARLPDPNLVGPVAGELSVKLTTSRNSHLVARLGVDTNERDGVLVSDGFGSWSFPASVPSPGWHYYTIAFAAQGGSSITVQGVGMPWRETRIFTAPASEGLAELVISADRGGGTPVQYLLADIWVQGRQGQAACGGVPGAPLPVETSRGPAAGQTRIKWAPPMNNGFLPILRYDVYEVVGDDRRYVATADADHFYTTMSIHGLPEGGSRNYTVVATNAAGPGAESAPIEGRSPSRPPPPRHFAEGGDARSIWVWWYGWGNRADVGGSPVIGYRIYRGSLDEPERFVAQVDGQQGGFADGGVVPGVPYRYRVTTVTEAYEGEKGAWGDCASSFPDAIRTVNIWSRGIVCGSLPWKE